MIDFHCHIDLFPDPTEVIRQAEAEGIYVLAVTTTPKAWMHLKELLNGKKRIRGAIGLHPELVAVRAHEVEEVCQIMTQEPYVGEIGLDGSPKLRSSFSLQERVFNRVLARSSDLGGRVLSIHSRRAVTPVLNALERHPKAGAAILHWFSGSPKELERAVAMGSWFSVGPAMLQGAKGIALASAMPQRRVLTESDGPFAQLSGKPLTPHDVAFAERALAGAWGMELNQTQTLLRDNLKRLLSTYHPSS